MKYLFNNGTLAMAVNDDEYRIGQPAKNDKGEDIIKNPAYVYRPDIAVRTLAKKLANEEASDLWEWIAVFNEVCETLTDQFKNNPENNLEKQPEAG